MPGLGTDSASAAFERGYEKQAMIVRHASKEALEVALDVANALYGGNLAFRTFEPVTRNGMGWRVQLTVKNPDGPGTRQRQRRYACWHAHRDWLYALFERVPDAMVRTGQAFYRGLEGFKRNYRQTAHLSIGPLYEPYPLEDVCNCAEFPRLRDMIPDYELGGYALDAERPLAQGVERGVPE